MLLGCYNTLLAQADDSLVVQRSGQSKHSATGALWRSAVIPGWGQLYNKQPLKVPVVVAALAGLTVLAVHNDKEFNRYNKAYLYGAYLEEDPHPFPEYESDYLAFPGVSTTTLRSQRDAFKRNRDLTIIGMVVAYGLNVLDAYVSGHLFDFDVGEDLSANQGVRTLDVTMSVRIQL
jgi:hypothetical protein